MTSPAAGALTTVRFVGSMKNTPATTRMTSGNSFATAHMSGICALVRGKHPELTPFQVKSVLHLTAGNVATPDAA